MSENEKTSIIGKVSDAVSVEITVRLFGRVILHYEWPPKKS